MTEPEKPIILIELEKEIASLKERLRLVEDVQKELIECYQKKNDSS